MRNSISAVQLQKFLETLKAQTYQNENAEIAAYNTVYRDISRSLLKADNELLSMFIRSFIKTAIIFDDGVKKLKLQEVLYKVVSNARAYQNEAKIQEFIIDLQNLQTYGMTFDQEDSKAMAALLQHKFQKEKEFDKIYFAVSVFTRFLKSEAVNKLMQTTSALLTEENFNAVLSSGRMPYAPDETTKYLGDALPVFQEVATTLFNLITDKNIKKELQLGVAQEKAAHGKNSKEVYVKRLQLLNTNINDLNDALLTHAKEVGVTSYYIYRQVLDYTTKENQGQDLAVLSSPFSIMSSYGHIVQNVYGNANMEVLLFNAQITEIVNAMANTQESVAGQEGELSKRIHANTMAIIRNLVINAGNAVDQELTKDAVTLFAHIEEISGENITVEQANEKLAELEPAATASLVATVKKLIGTPEPAATAEAPAA